MGTCHAVNDAYVQELYLKHSFKHPEMQCEAGNRVTEVCIRQECSHNALRCGADDCRECEKAHADCPTIKFKQLTQRLAQRQEGHKEFLAAMMHAEEELVKVVQNNREKVFQEVSVAVAGQHREAVRRLYGRGDRKGFTPRVAKELWETTMNSRDNEQA